MKEIGSEFWLEKYEYEELNSEIPPWLDLGVDNQLLLSGRTAIDFALKDIQKNKDVKTVYFPSYCCQSMLQPFIDNGIRVIFYDVYFEEQLKFNVDITQECDIFFAMNYFGFTKGRMDKYIEAFKLRNVIVIEDITHSLLSNISFNIHSDYIVASLRKWFPIISGGIAVKINGCFDIKPKEETLEEMIKIKKSAMLDKAKYINGDSTIKKEKFLNKYRIASEMLNKDYSLYIIDNESYRILQSINLDSIIKRRRENAKILYEHLSANKKYKLIFSELSSEDCPLFVPMITFSNTARNSLRRHLINNSVFCPVHWPKPSILNSQNLIFDKELSLVIDQRYDVTDMLNLIRRLEEFDE